jgi:hypothetical protein
MEAAMEAQQMVQHAMRDNPEIQIVLEIAARARDAEAMASPQQLGTATEVVAIPTSSQCAV